MSAPSLLFVHGSGRTGVESWPAQAHLPGARFLTLPGFGERPLHSDARRWAIREIADAIDGNVVVVASSLGGVLTAEAVTIARPLGIVLLEPAMFFLAAARPATRALIDRVGPLYRAPLADGPFLLAFLEALTGGAPETVDPAWAARRGRRERIYGPPWSYEPDVSWLAEVPTLVLTGDWAEEYEEVARELAARGALHRTLRGSGHRVQDHPCANDVIGEFVASVAGESNRASSAEFG